MVKTGSLILVAALAVALFPATATAGNNGENRPKFRVIKPSDGLARNSANYRKKRRTLFGVDWWTSGDGVQVISGSESDENRKKRRVITVNDDPEGDPGLGMGNLPYVAEKLVPLGGLKFAEQRPVAPGAAEIYDALIATGSGLRVTPDIREAIADHYRQQNFRPLWSDGGKFSPRGAAVIKTLAAADAEGLDKANYLPPVLISFDSPAPESNPVDMARLDIELTASALTYARHASGGQFDPRRLSLYNDITPERTSPGQAIKVLGWTPFPAEYLMGLHPRHPAYAAMKSALAALRSSATAVVPAEPIADGKIVKTGTPDERIEAVRQRLASLGYAPALEAADDPQVLDADLAVQLRLFQKASGIKPTGSLGPQTIAALNTDVSGRDLSRLLSNMERVRWLPKSLGTRYIFVNQPAFKVRVIDQGREVWQSRVIIGKPNTQTNAFHDEMETVVFNPSWGVPPSIIANEYLPKLRNDPGYLDRIGFKVVDAKGKVVRSSNVDWRSYGNKVPFGIQQPPGPENALGKMKFLFPNTHNIYMHDTPSRELFDKDVRTFSHGCVRVQNPREFAALLLGWTAEKVDETVDTKKSQTIRLASKVPVHITYFTAWPDETGAIQYFNDIYGRDQALENARTSITLAQR